MVSGFLFAEDRTMSSRITSTVATLLPFRGVWESGTLWEDNGLIFASETGTPLRQSTVDRRSFKPLLKRARLEGVRFHDLRHTCATLLLSHGVHPKFVQELLGHASITMTLDRYSHWIPSMGDQTARAMEAVLG